jgi:tripartite-type tricarboxylate transporter receptor subunit TctC
VPIANTWSVVLLLVLISCARADAQGANDFSGKTVTVLSSSAPGGGYDLYSRLFAAHLSAHLPGNPTVIVRNMPGAGGLTGADFLYGVAPKDGTMLGMIPQTVAIAHVFGGSGVRFDPTKFGWLGRINSNVEVEQTWFTSAVKKIADAKMHEVTVAGTGPDSSSAVFPRILDGMFGMKFKIVTGYQSATMATLAMEKGEVEGIVLPWTVTKSIHPDWLRDNKINLLVQYAVERNPELGDVPAVVDLAENATQRQILTLYASGSAIGRSIVAPPGLSASMLETLRAAFDATMTDQGFLDEMKKSHLDFDPLSGARLQEIVQRVEDVPASVIETARKYSEGQK